MKVTRINSGRAVLFLVALLCSCRTVWEEKRWVGLTEGQIKAKLGEPDSTSTLLLKRGVRLFEYQSGLYDHLPAKEEEVVEVREMQWKGTYKTTAIWLMKDQQGEWVVAETLVWLLGVSF
jgi:regulator of protease activity HflC (stomatin/prohibitin superfamily)